MSGRQNQFSAVELDGGARRERPVLLLRATLGKYSNHERRYGIENDFSGANFLCRHIQIFYQVAEPGRKERRTAVTPFTPLRTAAKGGHEESVSYVAKNQRPGRISLLFTNRG
jgi:hypothetical protein